MYQALRFARLWLLGGLLLMLLVLLLMLLPLGELPVDELLDDKDAHLLVFGLLMLWFGGVFRPRTLPAVAAGLLAFGALIEVLQGLLPYRSAEFADLLFDAGGIVLGWALAVAGLRHWTRWIEAGLAAGES
ncbi:MAG: VanZ family protein [Gammaproteobacteria bacterium]|nr:MAG: VanZ family protein [Gammaproteobacteria bacterium]